MNIMITFLQIVLVGWYQFEVYKAIKKSNFLNQNLENIPIIGVIATFCYSTYLIVVYEILVSREETIKPSLDMMNYSWQFYKIIIYQFLVS